jgi:hypothetical protein
MTLLTIFVTGLAEGPHIYSPCLDIIVARVREEGFNNL